MEKMWIEIFFIFFFYFMFVKYNGNPILWAAQMWIVKIYYLCLKFVK